MILQDIDLGDAFCNFTNNSYITLTYTNVRGGGGGKSAEQKCTHTKQKFKNIFFDNYNYFRTSYLYVYYN